MSTPATRSGQPDIGNAIAPGSHVQPAALLHGLADATTVLTANPLPDWAIGVVHTFYLGFGLWLVRAAHIAGVSEKARIDDIVSG